MVGVLSDLNAHRRGNRRPVDQRRRPLDQDRTPSGPAGQHRLRRGPFTLARSFGVLGAALFWARLLRVLTVFVMLLLLAALVPERVRVISEEAPKRLFAAFFVGLLGYLGLWLAIALLSITFVGIFLAWFLFLVLKWLGIAGMFHFFGHRIGRSMGREISLLGAVLIGFVPFALLILLPSAFGLPGLIVAGVFWFVIWIFLEIPAVGLVILTRGGNPPARPVAVQPAAAAPAPGPAPAELPGTPTGAGEEEPGESHLP